MVVGLTVTGSASHRVHYWERRALLVAGAAALAIPADASAENSSADVAYAVADIVACRVYTRTVLNLVRDGAFQEARATLSRPPFTSYLEAAEIVTESPASGLSIQSRDAIKTKPLSVRLSRLTEAIIAEDLTSARAEAKALAALLDDVLIILGDGGLYSK